MKVDALYVYDPHSFLDALRFAQTQHVCGQPSLLNIMMLLCFVLVDVRRSARTSIIHLTRGHRYAPAYILSLSYSLNRMYNWAVPHFSTGILSTN